MEESRKQGGARIIGKRLRERSGRERGRVRGEHITGLTRLHSFSKHLRSPFLSVLGMTLLSSRGNRVCHGVTVSSNKCYQEEVL